MSNINYEISDINAYPVKGLQGQTVRSGQEVISLDRQFGIGKLGTGNIAEVVNGRSEPKLITASAYFDPEKLELKLSADHGDVTVILSDLVKKEAEIKFKEYSQKGILLDDAILNDWIAELLGKRNFRLVQKNRNNRLVTPNYQIGQDAKIHLADNVPYHLVLESEIQSLQEKLGNNFDIRNVKPNILARGENEASSLLWKVIEINGEKFFCSPTPRCRVFASDVNTGSVLKPNPLANIPKLLGVNGLQAVFGIYLVPLNNKVDFHVGDQIHILEEHVDLNLEM